LAGLLTIVALGFALGMRHACDADHVVAYELKFDGYRAIGVKVAGRAGFSRDRRIFKENGQIKARGWTPGL
jgi:hypothetical protein